MTARLIAKAGTYHPTSCRAQARKIRGYGVFIPSFYFAHRMSAIYRGKCEIPALSTPGRQRLTQPMVLLFLQDASIARTIPDGTSSTLMFVERYQICNGDWGYWGTFLNSNNPDPSPPQSTVVENTGHQH